MWTSTLDLDPARVIPTKLLGLVWPGAYFSSFAPLQVQNLPRQPLPAANWVRVRNSLAGICGSDLHLIFVNGDFNIAPAALPGHSRSYPGHEVVGEVIEVGEEVQTLHVGERVVLRHGPNCITAGVQPLCRSCAAGNYGLCENGSLPGPQPIGGGWSEEMLLHEHQLFPVSPAISDAQAVLLEPAAVAVRAVLRRLPRAGECALIIGAGSIGLLTLQVLRALAPDAQVHVLARHAFQVERAANMGAKIIYPHNSYQQISRLTSARLYKGIAGNKMLLGGYDVIFDTIGNRRSTHDALRWARAGGTVVVLGVNLHQMRIDLTPIWYQEINLIGTMGHGMENWPVGSDEQKSTFKITAELIANEQIRPEELITQRYMLSEYRAALLDAKKKAHNRAIKVVFDFSLQPASVVPNVRAAARQLRGPVSSDMCPSQPAPAAWPPETPLPVTHEPEETTEKAVAATAQQQGFNVTPQYGSLPGFQPDLEQLGISPPPVHDEEQGDRNLLDIAAEAALATATEPAVVTPPAGAGRDTGDATTAFTIPPAIDFQPDMERDYAWAQFITPQVDGEDSLVTPAPPQAVPDPAEAEVPAQVAPADEAQADAVTAANDPSPTVVVSNAKRTRRRKTTDLRTSGRKSSNGSRGQSSSEESLDVTNTPTRALQDREK